MTKSGGKPFFVNASLSFEAASAIDRAAGTSAAELNCFFGILSASFSGTSAAKKLATVAMGFMKLLRRLTRSVARRNVAPLLLVLLVSCVTAIAVSWLTASSWFCRATVMVGPMTSVLASRNASTLRAASRRVVCLAFIGLVFSWKKVCTA